MTPRALNIEYLDRPQAGWFALDVMREKARKRDWVALMVDVDPDELKHCVCKIAFLYVHPNEYRPDGSRTAREAWVRVPAQEQRCRFGCSSGHDGHAALKPARNPPGRQRSGPRSKENP